jgi:hypothetical protein
VEGSWNRISYRLGSDRLGYHPLKQNFKGHGVGAALMSHEKFTIAAVSAIVVGNVMIIVIAMECKVKFVEAESRFILSVPLRLLQLADQSVVHIMYLLSGFGNKKSTRIDACFRGWRLLSYRYLFALGHLPLSDKVSIVLFKRQVNT